jgi:glutamate racemase
MTGIFDSGSGGLNTVRYVKALAPDVDLVYLIDRARAPYGTRSVGELTAICAENVEELRKRGADEVLIACCTASTVHSLLPEELRKISHPIIAPVANRAKKSTRLGTVGVIATDHTVRSHAFRDALPGYRVHELALAELVKMIDSGLSDESIRATDKEKIKEMLTPVLKTGIDTLILGCTHFPALRGTVTEIAAPYGVRAVIDSAKIGAELIIKRSRKLKRSRLLT